MKKDPPLDESRVRFIWEQAVIPYIEEQYFGNEAMLKEFTFDRLKRELDAGSGQPEDATNEVSGQPEDSVGNASA